MKRITALLLALVMCFALCACGGTGEAKQDSIDLKGAFLLNPADGLDLSLDELDAVQRYFLVVFDVTNNSDVNEELSTFADSITLTMNGSNTYEQIFISSKKKLSRRNIRPRRN